MNTDGSVKSSTKIADNTNGGPTLTQMVDNFGISVTSLGDLNGDGVTDLAVGAAVLMTPTALIVERCISSLWIPMAVRKIKHQDCR